MPTFRIVLTDSKNSTKSGKYLEILGNHDVRNDANTEVKKDRVLHWLSQGAQLSPTLHNLFITKKIITGKKVNVLPKKTAPVKEVVAEVASAPVAEAAPQAPVEETPAPSEAPAA